MNDDWIDRVLMALLAVLGPVLIGLAAGLWLWSLASVAAEGGVA